MSIKLSKREKNLRDSIERGEWKSLPNRDVEIEKSVQAARAQIEAIRKEARVSLRLNSTDVSRMREKAHQAGIPYQTLIASVIHRFATDQLVERKILEELKDAIRREKKTFRGTPQHS